MTSRLKILITSVLGILLLVITVVYISNRQQTIISPTAVDITSSSLERRIFLFTEDINKNPKNVQSYLSLAGLYIQQIRETGDVSYNSKINYFMQKAIKLDSNNSDIYAVLANIELSNHNFAEGKKQALKAIELNPNKDYYYGLLGDAQNELGEYDEARKSLQKMVDMRPGFGSYSRIAYIRELHGDIPGAKQALLFAIDAGSSYKENIAWAYNELGKLESRTHPTIAKQHFEKALELFPDHPKALDELGKAAFFDGNEKKAEEYFKKAYEKLANAETATSLGDFYFITDKKDEAKKYYNLAEAAYTSAKKINSNVDYEESSFLLERDLNIDSSFTQAEKAYSHRQNIFTADNLSWAYYKKGNYEKANEYSKIALSLGKNDPTILYHQGALLIKNGKTKEGRELLLLSLKMNPRSSMINVKHIQNIQSDSGLL